MIVFIALIAIDSLGGLAAIFCLILLANHGRLALCAIRMRKASHAMVLPGDRPEVLLQIPVYNEPLCVEGALRAAARLDWPRDRICIQLLDDSTDHTSAIAAKTIAALEADGCIVQHIRRANRIGFKAGALSEGMTHSQAPFVALLDADFQAPPDWLERAVCCLQSDPSAGFVQFRFEYANRQRSLLTRAQQLSVDTHFFVEQAGRFCAGEIFQFNGTAGVWRREAIEGAGGWSGDTLTEDLDLVLRASAKGWRGQLVLHPPVVGEAPSSLATWRTQQARWSNGFMQVIGRSLPLLWRLHGTLFKKMAAFLLVAMQLAFPCAIVAVAALSLDVVLRGGILAGHVALVGMVGFVAASLAILLTYPTYRRLQRGRMRDYVMVLASLPVFLGFLAVMNSYGIVTAAFGRGRPFVRTPKTGNSFEK